MEIVNGTNHEINMYHQADTTEIQGGRKLVAKGTAKPYMTIPPGSNLDAKVANSPLPEHLVETGLPLTGGVVFTGYDPIPEGDLVVVSNRYRSAVQSLGGDTSRLAIVDGTVYVDESATRPCGCLRLAVG